ncbi:MAG: valine--tRNA ligase [Bacteroidetes bacterium]|nr:valine--tRNA ligase [Bacteroidota bacterium]
MSQQDPETTDSRNKPSAYDPHLIEERWYRYWEEGHFFDAEVRPDKRPHVIMMPPPNVTGRLHMGHALQDTMQDILTRMRRMQGYEALWMPGIDHAGIATQNVVEKTLKKEQRKDRHDLGREKFVEKVWEWKEEYGDIISRQKRQLGVSCDWRRQRFTMDAGFTRAVQAVFVRLFEEGLIYRGSYLVNWCPVDQTALSDEEVDNIERDGSLWYVRYPVVGTNESITVATTRPETMFGDTAVAVHPDDDRYRDLVGRMVRLPLTDREIPIIADEYVKSDFGAGALKVTPGHDKNDFEIGQRHGLPVVNVMNLDGTLGEEAGPDFAGKDRFVVREEVVAKLSDLGLLDKIEPYKGTVPVSSRSKAVIEPLVSRQWFVRMGPMAASAVAAVRDGRVTFHPRRWENEYFRWLENIRDWTISRQLWWGHRIPVWYYVNEDGEIDERRDFVVSVDQPEPGMVQDEDVLDTWFSSWLWPFATLGWPEKTAELDYFYPTTVLVSGYDILFFWIARMIMAGLHFTGEVPYSDVFITGMVKDKQGRWMSKSLGNGIDPLDMIEQYGSDAVRFSLAVLCAQGQDIKLDPLKFEMGRNFANKIWNAFNVFGQFMDEKSSYNLADRSSPELVERWMLHRLNSTIASVNASIERYRMNEAALAIYDVFWRDFCDWYLELIKPSRGEAMSDETIAQALDIYERMTQILHPFMPFITEELWWKLRPRKDGDSIMVSQWPVVREEEIDDEADRVFGLIQRTISEIRNIRAQYNVAPSRQIPATLSMSVRDDVLLEQIRSHAEYFEKLSGIGRLQVGHNLDKPKASASAVVGEIEIFVPLADMIDLDIERTRLQKEIDQKEGFLDSIKKKLANRQFVERAPESVVDGERRKEASAIEELAKLRSNLLDLDN